MKVLITGGNGFIAKYLKRAMDAIGWEFTAPSKEELDVTHPEDFIRFSVCHYDAVVHLAALLMIDGHRASSYFDVNAIGTFNALEFCRVTKVKTFIYTMTHSDVNLDFVHYPLSSDAPPCFGTGSWEPAKNSIPFIASKIAAKEMVEAYDRQQALRGVVLRLANIRGYGSRDERYNCVFHQFIQKALNGEDIEIWGNPPKTKRDLIAVQDVCSAIIAAIQSQDAHGTYNIGSGIGLTIEQEAEAIIEVFSRWEDLPEMPDVDVEGGKFLGIEARTCYKESKIIHRPDIPEVRKVSCVFDIGKAMKDLHWHPRYSYAAGLRDYKKEMGL